MRCKYQPHHGQRQPGAWAAHQAACGAQHGKQPQAEQQQANGILAQQPQSRHQAQHQPLPALVVLPGGQVEVADAGPKGHLRNVVVELQRGPGVEGHAHRQHGADKGALAPDEAAGREPDQPQGQRHAELAQCKRAPAAQCQKGHMQRNGRQRRVLVVAPLPFTAPAQALDHIERKAGRQQRRKEGPGQGVQAGTGQHETQRFLVVVRLGWGRNGRGHAVEREKASQRGGWSRAM